MGRTRYVPAPFSDRRESQGLTTSPAITPASRQEALGTHQGQRAARPQRQAQHPVRRKDARRLQAGQDQHVFHEQASREPTVPDRGLGFGRARGCLTDRADFYTAMAACMASWGKFHLGSGGITRFMPLFRSVCDDKVGILVSRLLRPSFFFVVCEQPSSCIVGWSMGGGLLLSDTPRRTAPSPAPTFLTRLFHRRHNQPVLDRDALRHTHTEPTALTPPVDSLTFLPPLPRLYLSPTDRHNRL